MSDCHYIRDPQSPVAICARCSKPPASHRDPLMMPAATVDGLAAEVERLRALLREAVAPEDSQALDDVPLDEEGTTIIAEWCERARKALEVPRADTQRCGVCHRPHRPCPPRCRTVNLSVASDFCPTCTCNLRQREALEVSRG